MMTTIAMGTLIAGVLLFIIGRQSGVKGKFLAPSLLFMVAGSCIGIFGNPSRDMPNGSPEMVIFGFLGIAAGIIMILLNNKRNAVVRKEARQIGRASCRERVFV